MNNTLPKRIVIKIGSSTLTNDHGKLDSNYIEDVAAQVSTLKSHGCEVVIVTSAAIAAGLEALSMPPARPSSIQVLQAAAAIGQLELAKTYSQCFAIHDIQVGQILLTRSEITNRNTYLHARDTIEQLLSLGALPLINENDTVAVDEIRFGDNDTLAAQVAILIKADLVILLSDIEGLYTADPRLDEDAQLLQSVGSFSSQIVEAATGAQSASGSGGMITKIEAARLCMAAGVPMVICEGHSPNVIIDAQIGKQVGTRFASDTPKRAKARKLWLALSAVVKGAIVIDEGAAKALLEQGSSLLPVGIKAVRGSFAGGDAVDILREDNQLLGRGLSAYSSDELALAVGKSSSEIAANKLLEHLGGMAAIHRDQMVVF